MKRQRRKGIALILALCMCISLLPATYATELSDQTEPLTYEYIFGLSVFNTEDLTTGSEVNQSAPVLYNGALWHKASMAWDAVVSGDYTTSGSAVDPFMDLTKTDKWAFVGTSHASQHPYLAENYLYTQIGAGSIASSYVAYKIYVDEPGKYTLQAMNMDGAGERGTGHHLDPKVYFFKEGTAGVTNTNKSTYPQTALVGTFVYNSLGTYENIGEVFVPEAGEYIVAFTCDATSPSAYTGNASPYQLTLGGLKLVNTGDASTGELESVALSTNDADLIVGDTANLTVKATYSEAGELDVEAEDVEFTVAPDGVVTVSNGVVTAIDAGTATVTATYGEKSDTVDFTVVENNLTGISLVSNRTSLIIGGNATLTVSEVWSATGEKAVEAENVTFAVTSGSAITVAEDGTVAAVKEGTATVTATHKTNTSLTDTLDFTVIDNSNNRDLEYVIGLSAFNYSDLKTGTAPNTSAPELQNGTAFYHKPSMAWDAVVAGDHTTSGEAIDPFMDLTATKPWAFVGTSFARQNPKLAMNYLYTQIGQGSIGGAYLAYKIYVDAPGNYTLQVKSVLEAGGGSELIPKVYLFKDGTEGVTNTNKNTYPTSALIGTLDSDLDGEYDDIGDVTIKEAGEYIVAFTADASSPAPGSASPFQLTIGGIKLAFTGEVSLGDLESISLSASDADLIVGDTANLTVKGTYADAGEVTIPPEDVTFTAAPTGVVSIDADGTVTAIGEGTATVTATYKEKTDTVDLTVVNNVFTGIELSAGKTKLFVDGETTLSVNEVWSASGKNAIANEAVTFAVSPEGVITVGTDGKVTAVAEGTATVTATHKTNTGMTDTVEISVVPIPAQTTYEFILGLSAFNKANMIVGANSRNEATEDVPYYGDAPVLRNTSGGVLYYKPAMHWDYIVPAKYSGTDPKADFAAMNLDLTKPWALEDYKTSIGQAILYDGMFALEFKPDNYGTDSPSYAAFRLNVEAPGEYILQAKANKQTDAPAPAVYFFRDGTEGVTNNTVSTYAENSKIGYFNIPKAGSEYTTMGRVMVSEPGEYIVAFVGDATSKEMNTELSGSAQRFQLTGLKLIPTSEDTPIGNIFLTAKNQLLMVGREMQIEISRNYDISGEVKLTDYENYTFTSADTEVATVDENGVVKGVAVSENPITITATHKTDPTLSATILFKVVPLSEQQTYEYKFISGAFNYDKLGKVPGIVPQVTDDYYYRDLLAELGFAGHAGVMIMNERLADPELIIPAGYYGAGNPTEPFYAMDTTELDGDAKGTDPWKYVGGKAIDLEGKTTVLQIRGDDYTADGFHPYYDRSLYTDGADTQFSAFSLDVPAAGEYMLTIDVERHGISPAPAIYFFKDEAGAYPDASFIFTAPKLGYLNGTNTKKQGYEYIANVNVPEAGKYVVAFVMDTNSANLAQGVRTAHGTAQAQYISLFGVKLIPSYEDVCEGISISAERDVMYSNETTQLSVNEVWDIAGEKEVLDISSIIFESSDTSIATVSDTGLVTGVAKGEVTITATKKNTYPEVKTTFKMTLYDPNESILGVKLNYVLGSTSMKDQTTYTPHNDRLDTSGTLRDLSYVDDYSEINGSKTALWAYHSIGSVTWKALLRQYVQLATKPANYVKEPYFVFKLRVPIRGEYYFEANITPEIWASEADFHLLPTGGIDTASGVHATQENYIGTVDGTGAANQRLGRITIPAPGDYYVIMKFHSENPNLNSESRHDFKLNGVALIAPPGEFAKVGMYVEGLTGEGDILPCKVFREFTYALTDAAGVALEDVNPADVVVNSITVTKGADVITLTKDGDKYSITTTDATGEVEITADITYKGKNVVTTFAFSVEDIGKTGRTIYTDEMVANARENIKEYDWAKSTRDKTTKSADRLVALGADYIWNMISGNGLPRSYCVSLEINHTTRDPYEFYCRYCNKNLLTEYGNYPWVVDAFNNPWKIKCPECSRSFPSNDFGSFYELGRTQKNGGLFDRNTALEAHRALLIGKGLLSEEAIAMEGPGEEYSEDWYKYYGYGVKGGYLYNDLYYDMVGTPSGPVRYTPESGETPERWAVDDGYGYFTGRRYENGVREVHAYIPYFNHFGVYYFGGTGIVAGGLSTLGSAYLLTGDEKYGRLGAIILDRVADVYPDMDLSVWMQGDLRYPNSTGGSRSGKDLGRIWAGFPAEIYADSYDIFYPMYDDPEVIAYLSEKAAYYGMENDKTSAIKLRKNGEDGICRAIFEGAEKAHIYGNFGLHQNAVIKAAIALDDAKDTAEMIDWLYAAQATDGNTYNLGGDVSSRLIDELYREGMNRESPYYNQMALEDLIDAAVALERYADATGGVDKIMLLQHPKYIQQFNVFQKLTLVHRGVKSFADTGSPLNYESYPKSAGFIKAFNATKGDDESNPRFEENLKMAQHLWLIYGEELRDQHYDIYTKNPESIYEEVKALIDKYGEYDYDKSTILTGYGIGVLRDGALYDTVGITGVRDTTRDFMMNFSGHNQHNHSDMLDLQIESYGIGLTYDFGYAEFMVTGDPHSSQLTGATIGHNTVVVDETNSKTPADGTPQDPLHFDALDTRVKVMDARTPDAYTKLKDYRRTIVMIDYDDEVSYGVDFFRVDGGSDHLYTFSLAANTRPERSDNIKDKFVKQVDEPQDTWRYDHGNYYPKSSYAGPTVQFGEDPGTPTGTRVYPNGYTWMYDVERADNPEVSEFWLDWAIEDFRNFSRNPNLDLRLRMTMLNDFNVDEISLTSLLPQRNAKNAAIDHFEKVLIRRKGEELDSLFTTVYEPYKTGDRYVTDIEQVAIARTGGAEEGANDLAKAVKVTLGENRVDYVVYATNRDVIYTITDGDLSFEFAGFVGVWTVDAEGNNTYSYLNDGSILGEGENKVENAESAVTGKIVDFQKELSLDNWVDIEFDREMSEEEVQGLVDRMIIPDIDKAGNSNYLIEKITKTGANTARIDLGGITTIDGFADSNDESKGYAYILEEDAAFEIPMSYEDRGEPVFDPLGEQTVSAGSMITIKVNATPATDDLTVTYKARILPRGAALDESTGTFSWKPTSTQLGKNLVAIDAIDSVGRISTIYFTVEVFGSTSGGSSGGGGGGGADVPPAVEPDEPAVEPDEPTDEPDAPSEAKGFRDLGNHAWAEESINALAEAGIIKGTSESTFAPANNITRADYAILLVRAFKLESENAENFADVSDADYFAKELAVARNTGIVGGIGDNKYAPRNTITRQDMMVILHRALTKQGVELTAIEGVDATTYADYEDVADYARDAVKALVEAGLVNGKGAKLAGNDKTTRAEVAVLLKRVLDYIK